MSDTKKDLKIIRPEEMISFSWGGTIRMGRRSHQVMHILQDQLDNQESDEELQKKIDYALKRHYWDS